MTGANKERHNPITGAYGRRKAKRQALLSAVLLASFVLALGYASLAVYQWARSVALTLPSARQVSPPSIVLPAQAQPEAPDIVPSFRLQPVASQAVKPSQPAVTSQTISSSRITLLLLGVDQRPDDPSPLLTDTMIVVTVEPDTNQVGMISLPRDLFVPIPGYDYSGKINTAHSIGEINKYPGGGGALAKKTVSEFLGYPIDYYVTLNFDGFVRAIDAIGGIDVVVPKTIHDVEYPTIDYGYQTFHIEAGPQQLDGETALKYVRTRKSPGDGDIQRAQRQQQVLLAVKDKLIENKLMTPVRLFDLFRVVSNSIKHDIPATRLPSLFVLASQVQMDEVQQLVIDTRFAEVDARSKFGWILVPNRAKIRPAVDQIFAGQLVQIAPEVDLLALAEQQARQQAAQARHQALNDYQTQAELLREQLNAEGARVGIYNGTGDPLLTARAADWLQRQGYNVVEAKEADRSDYPRTALITYSEKPLAVEGLTDMFAIARDNIRPGDRNTEAALDLRLIIGRDFYLLVSN
jgi:polyisoprenyl-teichoic acid--peptidoglycan teichoic acid transferase